MKIDREGFLAAISALGLLLPGLAGCDSTEDAADGGAGGEAAGGSGSGGEAAGGSGSGGEASGGSTGGSAAGGEAAGGATGGAGGANEDICAGEELDVTVDLYMLSDEILARAYCTGGTSFKLGLAETGAGEAGWYGEDCLPGAQANFDLCHTFGSPDGAALISLLPVGSPDAVVPGETTLLSKEMAAGITWVIIDADDETKCWVGGHDVTYYADLNCTPVE